MKAVRLDKYLADMGIGTRTEVKQYIKSGRTAVNGHIIKRPECKVLPGQDTVLLDNIPVGYAEYEYYMLNKPQGVVSATKDNHDTTVLDLIEDKQRKDLFPVGRLDKDTEGLLLLTNDGELAHQLLSPRHHVNKTYFARVEGRITKEHQELFLQGITIEEAFKTMPAKLIILSEGDISEIRITIQEGKFHQVKRMFEAIGSKVLYLKRLSMGPLMLDETLQPGEYRKLNEQEIQMLKNAKREELS